MLSLECPGCRKPFRSLLTEKHCDGSAFELSCRSCSTPFFLCEICHSFCSLSSMVPSLSICYCRTCGYPHPLSPPSLRQQLSFNPSILEHPFDLVQYIQRSIDEKSYIDFKLDGLRRREERLRQLNAPNVELEAEIRSYQRQLEIIFDSTIQTNILNGLSFETAHATFQLSHYRVLQSLTSDSLQSESDESSPPSSREALQRSLPLVHAFLEERTQLAKLKVAVHLHNLSGRTATSPPFELDPSLRDDSSGRLISDIKVVGLLRSEAEVRFSEWCNAVEKYFPLLQILSQFIVEDLYAQLCTNGGSPVTTPTTGGGMMGGSIGDLFVMQSASSNSRIHEVRTLYDVCRRLYVSLAALVL